MSKQMNHGAIALLDILGFKGIWKRKQPNEVFQIMNMAVDFIKKSFKGNPPESKWGKMKGPDIRILSDTIFIGFQGPQSTCIEYISDVTLHLFLHFLDYKLFFRGAIAHGDYLSKKNIYIGPAVDDVAAWYNEGNWIGVISTPRTNYLIDRLEPSPKVQFDGGEISVPSFIKYNVPFSNEKSLSLNCLNWPMVLNIISKSWISDKNQSRIKLESIYSDQEPFGFDVFEKYENTIKFADFCSAQMEALANIVKLSESET